MAVFISYDEKDAAAFSSICLALEGQRIEYLDVKKTMKVEELRDAIAKSAECCLILATKNSSVNAAFWINLGVFWVSGIRIFIFSDADLTEDQIPLQFQDMITRDLRQLISEMKKQISEVSGKRYAALEAKRKAEALQRKNLVSDLSVQMFYDMISSVQFKESRKLSETVILIREAFAERTNTSFLNGNPEPLFDSADLIGYALPLLRSIIGLSKEEIDPNFEKFFGNSLTLSTSSGDWRGYAMEEACFTHLSYENCVFLHYNEASKCDGAVISTGAGYETDQDEDSRISYGSIIASAGSVALGEPIELKPNNIRPWKTINSLSAG